MVYVTFPGHLAAPVLPTRWGWALFIARVPCLHTSVRGTPVLGYRQWPLGPPYGRLQACRWGQSLIVVPFWALADVVTVNPPSVMSPATSVPAAGGHVAPTPGGFVGPCAGRLAIAASVEDIPQRPLGNVRSCVTVCFPGGRFAFSALGGRFSRCVTCGPGPPCRGLGQCEH
jgi:hypothetical protein